MPVCCAILQGAYGTQYLADRCTVQTGIEQDSEPGLSEVRRGKAPPSGKETL